APLTTAMGSVVLVGTRTSWSLGPSPIGSALAVGWGGVAVARPGLWAWAGRVARAPTAEAATRQKATFRPRSKAIIARFLHKPSGRESGSSPGTNRPTP